MNADNNALIRLHQKFARTTLVETFQDHLDNSITFRVVDRKMPLLSLYDTRRMEFCSNDLNYLYSMIYLNKKKRIQPIYESVQYMAECFFPKLSGLDGALILGCAGCSIPRFFALSSPKCKITGIEFSETMVEIAKKHFVNDAAFENFSLIQGDAFSYVQNVSEMYNFVYVDLFLAEKNHPKTLSSDFLNNLNTVTAKESIVIFNLLNLSKDDCIKFALRFLNLFGASYVFDEQYHYYVAFVKTENPKGLRAFESRAAKYVRIDERYSIY